MLVLCTWFVFYEPETACYRVLFVASRFDRRSVQKPKNIILPYRDGRDRYYNNIGHVFFFPLIFFFFIIKTVFYTRPGPGLQIFGPSYFDPQEATITVQKKKKCIFYVKNFYLTR